jgi:hypothetical protein
MAGMRILIEEAGLDLTAALNDSATTDLLWRALPLEGRRRRGATRCTSRCPS